MSETFEEKLTAAQLELKDVNIVIESHSIGNLEDSIEHKIGFVPGVDFQSVEDSVSELTMMLKVVEQGVIDIKELIRSRKVVNPLMKRKERLEKQIMDLEDKLCECEET